MLLPEILLNQQQLDLHNLSWEEGDMTRGAEAKVYPVTVAECH